MNMKKFVSKSSSKAITALSLDEYIKNPFTGRPVPVRLEGYHGDVDTIKDLTDFRTKNVLEVAENGDIPLVGDYEPYITVDRKADPLCFYVMPKRRLFEEYDYQFKDEIFTDQFLKELNFKRDPETENTPYPQYGSASGHISNGRYTPLSLHWNNEGHPCRYTGEPVEKNIHLTIRSDGNTRTVFSGKVYNQDDVRRLIDLVL